jgi:acyl-[acyl-carrier-protein]-phospholipid O-acyltransferase / long-chain-fatty-acid--[acyl-carrier-protein] ligase
MKKLGRQGRHAWRLQQKTRGTLMKRRIMLLLLRFFARVFYRLRVIGPEHLPGKGGALLVSNHISHADMPLILAGSPRFVRFILPEETCEQWWLRPFLRALRVIPLPSEARFAEYARALGEARAAIQAGEVIGLFAERQVSRIGILLPFRAELRDLLADLTAPVVPVCLDGLWGSVFSYQGERFFWKLPSLLPRPATLCFGKPMPAGTDIPAVRATIQELNTEAWLERKRTMLPLQRGFIRRARRSPFRFAMADARVPGLSFFGALTKAVFLARRLRQHWAGQKMVGIMLPPSVAGALVNLAALLAGRVPVNLNYTLSAEAINACAAQCPLETIVSSRLFLDRLKLQLPGRTLLLEEIAAGPRISEKLAALGLSALAPASLLERAAGSNGATRLDDLATVIFSSGSTGDPKGVMLSHYNVQSNADQLAQTFNFRPDDRFLGILPFFHSFGFTAALAVPATFGLGVAYHPNPLEPKPVGDLVRRYRLTYLMATPAFLQIYLRGCEPSDFQSLRVVMAGAEKLPDWLTTAFAEKFGITPVEGYGCTECSPVIAANTHSIKAGEQWQVGSQRGKIGHPLPGVSARIVDPETGAQRPVGEPGLLLVRGPNVMQGYLRQPEKTAEALRDGWYVTGDIAAVDEDGFLQLTDRLSRFSKIGGEMVPHIKVEEKLHELAGVLETTFAVAAVSDAKKGERLVVLHTLDSDRLRSLLARLPELGLPNLWTPRPNAFYMVEKLPYLASGKLDLRAIRRLALEHCGI